MHAVDIKTAVTLSGVPAVSSQSIFNILICTVKTKTQSKAVDGCVRCHSRLGNSGLSEFLVHFQIQYSSPFESLVQADQHRVRKYCTFVSKLK